MNGKAGTPTLQSSLRELVTQSIRFLLCITVHLRSQSLRGNNNKTNLTRFQCVSISWKLRCLWPGRYSSNVSQQQKTGPYLVMEQGVCWWQWSRLRCTWQEAGFQVVLREEGETQLCHKVSWHSYVRINQGCSLPAMLPSLQCPCFPFVILPSFSPARSSWSFYSGFTPPNPTGYPTQVPASNWRGLFLQTVDPCFPTWTLQKIAWLE